MKTSYRLTLLAAAFAGTILSVSAQRIVFRNTQKPLSLDWLIEQENLWEKTPDDLEQGMGSANFEWQNKERTHARFNPDDFALTLDEHKIGETLVSFKNGKMATVTFSYLNKGDDYNIDQSTYTAAVGAAKSVVTKVGGGGVREEVRPKNEQLTKALTSLWRTPKSLMSLEHLFLEEEKFEEDGWIWTIRAHAEFVRLRMQPPNNQLGFGLEKFKTTATSATLTSRVKREGKKAIIEGIPMVNQGSKGYCAIASLERVLRYYGAEVDMHDLANVANSYGGTRPEEMKKAVRVAASKLKMASRMPIFYKQKDFKTMTDQYNRVAEKADKTKALAGELFRVADNQLIKDMRTKSGEFLKFKQEIVGSINRGVPVLWALYLGLYWEDQIEDSYEANRFANNKGDSATNKNEEFVKKMREERKAEMEKLRKETPRPPEHMQGGHMRLIIGYDAQEGVIFYTDSWGPGHEVKKMKLEEAYASTLAMMVIEPR